MKNGQSVALRLLDISEGGICAISQLNLREGLNCQLTSSVLLSPQAPTLLKHQVDVRYSVYSYHDGGFRVGLNFKVIDENLCNAIRLYVEAPKYGKNQLTSLSACN